MSIYFAYLSIYTFNFFFSDAYRMVSLMIWHDVRRLGCGGILWTNETHKNNVLICNYGSSISNSHGLREEGLYSRRNILNYVQSKAHYASRPLSIDPSRSTNFQWKPLQSDQRILSVVLSSKASNHSCAVLLKATG